MRIEIINYTVEGSVVSKSPTITYDFPEGEQLNPFDLGTDAKYFINASGLLAVM